MKISHNYIILIINKIFDPIKFPKFTKFINKYMLSFVNASANAWLLFSMGFLIYLSYKSQFFHLELLKELTDHISKKA